MEEERLLVNKTVERVEFDYHTLLEAREKIDAWIKKYGSDAAIHRMEEEYSDREFFALVVQVPETDEQMRARIAKKKRFAEREKQWEMEEYKRLKMKFEGGKST